MKSLIGYIGIKTTNGPTVPPPSGIYINSLPGITTQMLDRIAEKEHGSFDGVWNDIQVIAAERFYADTIAALMNRFKLSQLTQFIQINPGVELPFNGITVDAPVVDELRGIKIAFNRRTPSFEAIQINTITVWSPIVREGVQVGILAANSSILWTTTVDLVQGENIVDVGESFINDSLFIGADISTGGSYDTRLEADAISCWCKTVFACHPINSCRPTITGARHDGTVLTNDGSKNHGVGFSATMICDYRALIEHNKPLFRASWLYLLGNQTSIEVLASSMVNQYTTTDREQFVALRDHYQVEYEKALDTLIKGIRVPDSCCIKCDPTIRRVSWRP
jgi:hypothetical protein